MKRVFIVEDEAVVAMELKDHLRVLGYTVCGHAARGEAALRLIPSVRPDLVLMDINLGPGLNGLDVSERLREVIDVPVILLTAYSDAEITERSGRTGSFAYVVKPFEPRVLAANIELALVRHEATAALRESEARFSGVFEFAPDATLLIDEGGGIRMANRMAEELLGYNRVELLNLTVEALVPEVVRQDHAGHRALFMEEGRPRRMGANAKLWAVRKDGSMVQVEISLSPLPLAQGRLVVASLRDVSERARAEQAQLRLEEQLRQAQKMKSLGILAGGIAHDFNNLLAVIVGSLELARAEVAPGAPISTNLDAIAAASSRASELVTQILTFSRQQPTSRAITSVLPVLEEAARMLRALIPMGIEVVLEATGGVPNVLMDPTQIHQVLMNLGTNAWHAFDRPTGKISIHLDGITVDAASPPVPGMAPGRYARIQVTDDGRGMDAATLEHIFEPFFTTKGPGKGTGLGLAVVHGIVTDHGGTVTVESALGRGTKFVVYLPRAAGSPASSVPPPSPAARRGAGRVLVIDDEELLAFVAVRLLKGLGYTVVMFVSPAEALEAFRAEPYRFDAVITDHNMPDISGLDIARAIGEIRPELPVILASGYRSHSDDELSASNISRFVSKPYSGVSLSEALSQVLRR